LAGIANFSGSSAFADDVCRTDKLSENLACV
jgi:hypothetical protein